MLADGSRGVRVHHGGRYGSKQRAWWQGQEAESSQPQPQMQTDQTRSWGGCELCKFIPSEALPPARPHLLKVPQHLPNVATSWGPSV